ncbi:uncharacterized aarF domain-containing protein kinase 2-like [Chenopodium quinoa]|uniref:ABC1 atypical kinase-like domain-containing protein n=1 Tax=Chenopodium quinoa TaxID=63459 RepID=A0A803LL48_CHEQI|nr:uncharacterized aarF domain-containing protein kinase 2-like [Chenopodium quinoa]
MSRLLMFGNIRRATNSLLKTRGSSNLGLKRDGTYPLFQPCLPQYRLYSQFRHNHSGFMPNTSYKHPQFLYKNGSPRNYSSMYASNTVAHHAQIAWKRITKMRSSYTSTIPTISRAAGVFSIALTKSHLLVPGIFTLIFGELALTQRSHAESDYFSPSNTVYTRAQDGHMYMSRLISNVLEVLILLLRVVYLALLFSPSIAMAPFADSCGPQFRSFWLHVVHRTLERAGPAFIKWGQWAATRPDLFPRDLCSELAKLHSKAPEHSYAYTKKTVEQAFGRKITEIFESFDEKPVASGSIAQVHRAVLRFRHPGQKTKPTEVAVKVRHPGVGDSIRRDFVIINTVARISTLIPTLKWLRLDESVQQFATFMMSQVDLSREAANLNRFIYNFRRWRDVSFPKPLYPLVHPAVLVETFEHGESVSHYVDGFDGHERFKTSLAHIGTHALLKMLLVDNFIHADMHPGNILVRLKHGKRKAGAKSKPHVIFIDVGMTAELSKNDRVILLEFFKAVARRDGRTVAERALQLSKRQSCPNPEAFIQEVTKSFDFWATPEGDLVHPADAMQQLLEQVRHHKVNIDGDVCTVIVTTLVLEGWQRKLDPDYNVMHTLQTLLFKADWAKSLSYTIEGLMAP